MILALEKVKRALVSGELEEGWREEMEEAGEEVEEEGEEVGMLTRRVRMEGLSNG